MFDIDSYRNHSAWTTLDSLTEMLDDSSSLNSGMRAFILYLVKDLSTRKNSTKHYYVGPSQLDELNRCIQNIITSLSNYENNPVGYEQHLISSVQNAYSLLATNWPANNGRTIAGIAEHTAEQVIQRTQEQLDQVDEAASEIYNAQNRIIALKDDYESSIGTWKASHDETLKTYVDDFESTKDNILDEKRTEMADAVKEARDSTKKMKDDCAETIEAATSEATQTMEGFLNEANKILEDLKSTSNAIASKVIADDYGKYARHKTVSGWIYDFIAFAFSLAGIYLVWWFLDTHQGDLASAEIYKLAVAVATFTIAGFLFRRGTAQHKEAKVAKRTQLTLAQYRPFIANLDTGAKEEITFNIAERVFIKGEIDCDGSILDSFHRSGISEKDFEAMSKFVQDIEKTRVAGAGIIGSLKDNG